MSQIIKLIIVNAIPFIFKWLGLLLERNQERKEKKKEAIKEVKDGIKTGNNSKVTAGFDRLRNIK